MGKSSSVLMVNLVQIINLGNGKRVPMINIIHIGDGNKVCMVNIDNMTYMAIWTMVTRSSWSKWST